MLPTISQGMDNKTRIELLRMTVEQQIAKCERALKGKEPLDPDARAIIGRYKKELEDMIEIIEGLEAKGFTKIWRRSKATARLAKKLVTLKSSYNIEELQTIEKVLK